MKPRKKPSGKAIESFPPTPPRFNTDGRNDDPHVDIEASHDMAARQTKLDFEVVVLTLTPESFRWLRDNAPGWRDHLNVTVVRDTIVMTDEQIVSAQNVDFALGEAVKTSAKRISERLAQSFLTYVCKAGQMTVIDEVRAEATKGKPSDTGTLRIGKPKFGKSTGGVFGGGGVFRYGSE